MKKPSKPKSKSHDQEQFVVSFSFSQPPTHDPRANAKKYLYDYQKHSL